MLQKSVLLAGGALAASDTKLFTNQNEFAQVPAQAMSSTSTCWMTVNRASTDLPGATNPPTLGVIAITGTPNGTGGAVAQTETDLRIANTNLPPMPRQESTSSNDTALDDRLVSATWFSGELWTAGNDGCLPTGDTMTRDCMRLDEVAASPGSTPTLGVFGDNDVSQSGLDEYYPAVTFAAGNVFMSYSASSANLNPGTYAVINPESSGASGVVTIAAGQAAYNGGTSARWGTYSSAAPDPVEPGNAWVAGEYTPSDAGQGDWGTAVAQIGLTAPPAPAVAVAALGTNGVPYAQAPQLGAGWHSLGGKVTAPPAVAADALPYLAPASPLFIAPGTNHLLYIRGVTGSWVRIGPNDASCLSAAALITGDVLQVACEGLDHGLYYDTAVLPTAGGLPQFTSKWKGLGGVGTLAAGPAVARVNGALTFLVLATDGRIHTRTISTGFTKAPWACLGQPAMAQETASQDTIFACEADDHGLIMSANGGLGWSPTVRLSGTLAAGPGIAATSRESAFLLVGTNHGVYEGTPTTSYTRLGSLTVTGVEAAALN